MLKAAFGKVTITPEEIAPLQGYDPAVHIANPETDILDDLYARILVLEHGRTRTVLISADCCLTNEQHFLAMDPGGRAGVFRDFANTFPEGTRRLWGEAAGVPVSAVAVHATHTHSAPEHFNEKYTRRIVEKLREVSTALQPVQVKFASGHCSINVNRRPHLCHNDALPIDHALHVLLFELPDGRPLGGIVHCAVHPTLATNPQNCVTAEFVGLAMKRMEALYEHNFVSVFLQGFSGDVGPIYQDWSWKTDTYPLVRQRSRELFADIQRVWPNLQSIGDLPVRNRETTVLLPTRSGYTAAEIEVVLHAALLGEIVFFSASCEVFNGYTKAIQRHFPHRKILLCGLTNGYHGYLPTADAFNDGLGGYEITTTPYAIEACSKFVAAAICLITSLIEGRD